MKVISIYNLAVVVGNRNQEREVLKTVLVTWDSGSLELAMETM